MWAELHEFDPGDLYDDGPAGDFSPMKALVTTLRGRQYANRLSAYTSHSHLTLTPALDYSEADRFDSVVVDYGPRTKAFTISYLKRYSRAGEKGTVFGSEEAAGRVDALVQRLFMR